MRNKETGEFELVVGDKQLLSGFFIGVLLLAVVFAMGYVLGQNSPHSNKAAETASGAPLTPGDARPQAASPAPPSSDPSGPVTMPVTTPGGEETKPAETPAETPPQPTTQPARDPATPTAAAQSPAPATAAAVAANSGNPPPPGPNDAPGTFWQVTATNRTNAEAVLAALKEKGMPASLRTGPKNLTVVWVGPYKDKSAMGKAKGELENLGFSGLQKRPQ